MSDKYDKEREDIIQIGYQLMGLALLLDLPDVSDEMLYIILNQLDKVPDDIRRVYTDIVNKRG
jgi:hypothetical protein